MSARPQRRFAPLLAWLLTLGLVLSTVPGFGSAEEHAGAKEQQAQEASPEVTPAGTPKPQYPLGPDLRGRYDLTLLLANERVSQFRYEIGDIRANIGRGNNWAIQMSIVLEFGSGSGVAESEIDDIRLREIVRTVLLEQSWQQLLTTAGKLHFTQQLIAMFNGTFKTAGVRQIYFSEICIARI